MSIYHLLNCCEVILGNILKCIQTKTDIKNLHQPIKIIKTVLSNMIKYIEFYIIHFCKKANTLKIRVNL